jgi:hypothetical protein
VRVGTGRLRLNFPERGPFGDTWINPSEVVAVESYARDVHYRDRSRVVLRSGEAVIVYGTVDEVLADLASPQSAWCACLGTPEPPPTWYFIEGHGSNGPTDRCGFADDDDEGWFDMNTSDAYEGTP